MTRKGKCVKCGLCSKACPFGFNSPKDAKDGLFRNPDCIHCRRCIDRCPRHALTMGILVQTTPPRISCPRHALTMEGVA